MTEGEDIHTKDRAKKGAPGLLLSHELGQPVYKQAVKGVSSGIC
jgi:hypothetical protein